MTDNDSEVTELQSIPARKKLHFWGNIGILLSGVAAACLIVVIIWTSYGLLVINSRFASALIDLNNRFKQSEMIVADAQKNANHAEKSAQAMDVAMKEQSQRIEDIQKNERTNRDDFLVAQSQNAVRMASDSLQYENNIPVAIRLLQSADQDIARASDNKVYAIREAFAADLAALKAAPQVDVAGVYVRLSALDKQIDKLKLIAQTLSSPAATVVNPVLSTLPWWRRGWDSFKQALQSIVVIRNNAPDAMPFIAPDRQVYFYQNLHVIIENAQWGLLHRQLDIYQRSLSQASDWIQRYATPDSPVTKQMLQELAQLQKLDVHPAVPVLTASLQALQNYSGSAGK